MSAKKTTKRPSVAGRKFAEYQGADRSSLKTSASSRTGTPHLQRNASDAVGKPRKPKRRLSKRFVIIGCAIIAVLAIGTGLLAWNQWFRYDDTADIQGRWIVAGSDDSITITPTDMIMTADVSYPYTLDTFKKTITFSFEQYSGEGNYAFSPERNELVITETDASTGDKISTTLVKSETQ